MEDERLAKAKQEKQAEMMKNAQAEEESKAQAAQVTASDPARQSHSQDFMKNMDQAIMNKTPTLPDLTTSKLGAVSYQKRAPQPFEEIDQVVAATAQPANISQPS